MLEKKINFPSFLEQRATPSVQKWCIDLNIQFNYRLWGSKQTHNVIDKFEFSLPVNTKEIHWQAG